MTMNVIICWTGASVIAVGATFFAAGVIAAVKSLIDDLDAWLAGRMTNGMLVALLLILTARLVADVFSARARRRRKGAIE